MLVKTGDRRERGGRDDREGDNWTSSRTHAGPPHAEVPSSRTRTTPRPGGARRQIDIDPACGSALAARVPRQCQGRPEHVEGRSAPKTQGERAKDCAEPRGQSRWLVRALSGKGASLRG